MCNNSNRRMQQSFYATKELKFIIKMHPRFVKVYRD